jgi:DNA polymerase III delta subunit
MAMQSATPMILLSGGQVFLRQRKLHEIIFKYETGGWVSENLDSPRDIHSYLGGFASLFAEPRLLVLETEAELPVADLLSFGKNPDASICFVLCYPGEIKAKASFAQLAKEYSKYHIAFPVPSPFKEQEVAQEFCVQEAKRLRCSISAQVASALIADVGSDIGILSYEIFKAATFAKSKGEKEISALTVKATRAVIAEASVWNFADALRTGTTRKIIRSLDQLAFTRGKDTMMIIGILRNTFLLAAQAIDLNERGVSPQMGASLIKTDPWKYTNIILPLGRRWGRERMFKMLQEISKAEQAVLSGAVDPWNVFVCGILSAVS